MTKPFYVTTPIYYVNDRPHIGHVYTTTIADVLARYHRLCGEDVFFLTGTDEHAAKVVDAAAERGMTTQAWADHNAAQFEQTFARLGMSHDDFIRTSQPRHVERVQKYVAQLLESGDVYQGEYEGWYDPGQEEYVTESEARKHDYKSPISGKPLVKRKEHNYFFRLSAYAPQLLELFEKGDVFDVRPTARKNEIVSRIRDGLNDVPISRTVDPNQEAPWGIRVPGDDAHVIYVWIDALFNYLSTIDTDEPEDRRKYWPADVHLIAKDILWFHAAIWPAMILALRKRPGLEWVDLPRMVYSHSFWISEGQKMSKSLGNFIDLEKIDSYVAQFSLDALRWFLATRGPLGVTDSDFSADLFAQVYNSDLANTLGNCASRVINMTNRYFDGSLPAPGAAVAEGGDCRAAAEQAVQRYVAAMDELNLSEAGQAALDLIRFVDTHIEQTQPFKRAKEPERLPEVATILHDCAQTLAVASVLFWPFMPEKVAALWGRLGCEAWASAMADRGVGEMARWATWGGLAPGVKLVQGEPLFPRVS